MALNAQQTQCYTDTIDVWRTTLPITDGDVGEQTWARVVTGLPCAFEPTLNDDDVSPPVGRIKRRINLTEDNLFTEAGADVQSQDFIVLTTAGHPERYKMERVEGAPNVVPSQGVWDVNEQSLRVFEDEHPPATILAAY